MMSLDLSNDLNDPRHICPFSIILIVRRAKRFNQSTTSTLRSENISSPRNMDTDSNVLVVPRERLTNLTLGDPMMRSQPLMRQTQCERTLVRPIVSCDSIHTWARSNSKATPKYQILTPCVETIWSLNQRQIGRAHV